MSEIPSALESLQAIAPGTILAGGYLRDYLFGRPPKDLDFFAPAGVRLSQLREHFPTATREGYSEFLQYCCDEVDEVFDLGRLDGIPAQLIVLRPGFDPAERVALHDFGLCQVWADSPDLLVHTTVAFQRDCADRTFTLVRCSSDTDFERSMKRWARLQEKYPEFTLVIPKEHQQWQTNL
jgi:uncharacterized short protein YbdD (DUF466 family)